jgi:hypothetical protein
MASKRAKAQRNRVIEFVLVFLILTIVMVSFEATLKRWIIHQLLVGWARSPLWILPARARIGPVCEGVPFLFSITDACPSRSLSGQV